MSDEQFPEHHDDSRVGQSSEPGNDAQAVDEQSASVPEKAGRDAHGITGNAGDGTPETDSTVEAGEVVRLLQSVVGSEYYSGMLPDPKHFNQYPKDVQERMCRWNDAFTVDESQRQDRLVDAEIDQSSKSMWISATLFTVCIVAAFVSLLVTGSAWSMLFLSVPVASMVLNIFVPVGSRSSRDKSRGQSDKETRS